MTEPEPRIPIEALIAAPFAALLDNWRSAQLPDGRPEPPVDGQAVLDAVETLTRHSEVAAVRAGLVAGDARAERTVKQLAAFAGMAAESLSQRVTPLVQADQWEQLWRESVLGIQFAAGVGQAGHEVTFLNVYARACRRRGDLDQTIAAYSRMLDLLATDPTQGRSVAVVADNLGNALGDAGLLDEALAYYDVALAREDRADGRAKIRMNRANALAVLGELHAAAATLREVVAELEGSGIDQVELGFVLDNQAVALASLGETDEALALLERARGMLSAGPKGDRAKNALSRGDAQLRRGDELAAAAAYAEARALLEEEARESIEIDHYRDGFRRARARGPEPEEARKWFFTGLRERDRDAATSAAHCYANASTIARESGHVGFALRMDANRAAMLADANAIDEAIAVAVATARTAASVGLARPELMVLGTLGALAMDGADVHLAGGALGVFCRAKVLLRVQEEVLAAEGIAGDERTIELVDAGTINLQLGTLAMNLKAYEIAIADFGTALAKGREFGGPFELANRLVALLNALTRGGGDSDEASRVAAGLQALMDGAEPLSPRTRLVGERALAFRHEDSDRAAAIRHLRAARDALDEMRALAPPGAKRTAVGSTAPRLHDTLARWLREDGQDGAAFEALQGGKGRGLIDALAARAGSQGSDAPASVDEVIRLLATLDRGTPTVLVDIAGEPGGITAYIVSAAGVRALHVPGEPPEPSRLEGGDVAAREARVVEYCRTDPLLGRLVTEIDAAAGAGSAILLVPDPALRNLPLHLCPVRGAAWCERAAIGTLGAAAALRFAPSRRAPTGRALVAGDSDGSLPHARAECIAVAKLLGTQALLGADCSRAAIAAQSELDVVHLALHGRGDVRHGGRASLLLANDTGTPAWIAFAELAELAWRAELVVLSGCSTAVAGARHGYELLDVASAAANAGAAAVIACLWPVGDEAASVCMQAFHVALAEGRRHGPVDLRVALDHGRAALRAWLAEGAGPQPRRRDGRREVAPDVPLPASLDPALQWGPFVLIGDPIVGD